MYNIYICVYVLFATAGLFFSLYHNVVEGLSSSRTRYLEFLLYVFLNYVHM